MASAGPNETHGRFDVSSEQEAEQDAEGALEEVAHDHVNTRSDQKKLLDHSPRGYRTDLDVHFAVWDNDISALSNLLRISAESKKYDLETRDPQGYTPLLLAYALGHTTAAYMLLLAGAFPKSRTLEGWEAIHLAALSGKPDMVRLAVIAMLKDTDLVFERRLDKLFEGLKSLPDMTLRMTWEFSSWIPFVSRLLPKDTNSVQTRKSSSTRFYFTANARCKMAERTVSSKKIGGRHCLVVFHSLTKTTAFLILFGEIQPKVFRPKKMKEDSAS